MVLEDKLNAIFEQRLLENAKYPEIPELQRQKREGEQSHQLLRLDMVTGFFDKFIRNFIVELTKPDVSEDHNDKDQEQKILANIQQNQGAIFQWMNWSDEEPKLWGKFTDDQKNEIEANTAETDNVSNI